MHWAKNKKNKQNDRLDSVVKLCNESLKDEENEQLIKPSTTLILFSKNQGFHTGVDIYIFSEEFT